MKTFETPDIQIEQFDTIDVLTVSDPYEEETEIPTGHGSGDVFLPEDDIYFNN